MDYSISFLENDYKSLTDHLFTDSSIESAAYLLCSLSKTDEEIRLIVNEVIPVEVEDIEEASEVSLKIRSISYVRAIKKARNLGKGFVFVHSHPVGFPNHSIQDDSEEKSLFKTVYSRIPNCIHASIVFSQPNNPSARIWLEDGSIVPVSTVRSIGERFKFFSNSNEPIPHPEYFDRQIKAFGEDIQTTLGKLKIGVVGAGGTGSAVSEQLIRLGVGTLFVFDHDMFDKTNVNRVFGSRVSDEKDKLSKVEIISRLAEDIGLGTVVKQFQKSITFKSAIEELKKCDIVFGCTDDQWGRMILGKLAVYYYIPVIDMGVKIDSEDQTIRSVQGRATVLLPNNACLFCREQISPQVINAEIMQATNPKEAEMQRKEGYIPELPNTAPAVVPFTSIVASTSVIEMLHRLTGFIGENRQTNEVIHLFDLEKRGKNSRRPIEGCYCGNIDFIGRGDVEPFLLDITWRDED